MPERRFTLVRFHTQQQDRSSSPLRSGAYLFVAVRLSPLRDEARACREASAAALAPPSILRPPEALSEAEVIEAEAELKALQRHALELVDPEA